VYTEGITNISSIFLASKLLGAEAHSVLYEDVPFTVSIINLTVKFCNQVFQYNEDGFGLLKSSRMWLVHGDCSKAFVAVARRIENFDIVVEIMNRKHKDEGFRDWELQAIHLFIDYFVDLVKRETQASNWQWQLKHQTESAYQMRMLKDSSEGLMLEHLKVKDSDSTSGIQIRDL
jgi:hypothetical protein